MSSTSYRTHHADLPRRSRHGELVELLDLPRIDRLREPATTRGVVSDVTEVTGTGLPCAVRQIDVFDPYVAADPESYRIVTEHIGGIESFLEARGFDPCTHRVEALGPEQWNPFTRAWLAGTGMSALAVWRSLVPTAEALEHLTSPDVGAVVRNRRGESAPSTCQSAAYFRFGHDAIGIRDRGVAMSHLLTEHFTRHDGNGPSTVLSLASGTAQPVLAAAREAHDATGRDIRLTVADLDGHALSLVQRNARHHGLADRVRTIRTNILDHDLDQILHSHTGTTQFGVVENMGFEEYLPEDGDELGARNRLGLPQASEFTRRAFDLVEPGGMLISGNMALGRTQSRFVFGVVDWPLINARSEAGLLRVYARAGLLDDPRVQIVIHRVRDALTGVRLYNIVTAGKLDDRDR